MGRILDQRPALIGAIGILLVIVASISALLWRAYEDRPMRKIFLSKDVPEIGLRAGLRTERIESSVIYKFRATPLSESLKSRMNAVLRERDHQSIRFLVNLEDSGGFELCSTQIAWHPDLTSDGSIAALSGQGEFPDCPVPRYAKSSNWNLQFHYPLVSEDVSPKNEPEPPKPLGKTPPAGSSRSRTETTSGINVSPLSADVLTGADAYSGSIETLDGHSLLVTREAEKYSLVSWQNGDSLRFDCAAKECIVADTTRNQTIHARLIR